MYWPQWNINTIGMPRIAEGYKAYTTASDTISVLGPSVDL